MIDFKDTPNPNAKKIDIQHKYEIGVNLSIESAEESEVITKLLLNPGIKSIFTGPGFLTVLKEESADWTEIMKSLEINTDII
ncbi:MAG: NifU N-terminal domain-containing protein [Candidatus Actinomarina sp.]